MVIEPGGKEGGPRNRHRGADQWLFVVSGRGSALINGKRHGLRAGSLLLIEHGDLHEIKNTDEKEPLRTLNLYVPPAYTEDGEELSRGRDRDRQEADMQKESEDPITRRRNDAVAHDIRGAGGKRVSCIMCSPSAIRYDARRCCGLCPPTCAPDNKSLPAS